MSKSKGEFLTVSLLEEKGYDPMAYRFFCLQSHYRKPLVFSYDALDQASGTYKKLKNRIAELSKEGISFSHKADTFGGPIMSTGSNWSVASMVNSYLANTSSLTTTQIEALNALKQTHSL